MSSKICSTCKIEQPIANFNKNRSRKDGYHSECAACQAKYRQRSYAVFMVINSKTADKNTKREYNEDDYIDAEWIQTHLTRQNEHCIYCECLMLFGEGVVRTEPDGLTIERKDNDIAHIKSNCALACYYCNHSLVNVPLHIKLSGYGPNLKYELMRWCKSDVHGTDDEDHVLMIELFGANRDYCKKCRNIQSQGEYQNRKRAARDTSKEFNKRKLAK